MRLARSSWTIPISAFATSTNPNSASCTGPTTMMIASIAPRIALNRVKMFARTIWATVRVVAAGTSFVRPSATRAATSAGERPRAGSTSMTVLVSLMPAERNGRERTAGGCRPRFADVPGAQVRRRVET